MDTWEKLRVAQRMQDYIHQHISENITLEDICEAAMYSKWHSFRIFKEVFHKTPFEYIRAMRLTKAARDIKNDFATNILDVAMNNGFASHEGFSKAFHSYFGVNPNKYRYDTPRRYMYFDPSPILHYYLLLNSRERIEMAENQRTVTVFRCKNRLAVSLLSGRVGLWVKNLKKRECQVIRFQPITGMLFKT